MPVLLPTSPSQVSVDEAPPLAVVIGVARHADTRYTLQTPVNDATALGKLLAEQHGYEIWLCLNEEASLERLRSLLHSQLKAAVTAGRRLLFYFAGHGIAQQNLDGPRGYLVPFDASGEVDSLLPMQEVHEALQALPCSHLLVILDCCFAGTFRWAGQRDLEIAPPALFEERYQLFLWTPAWQVLTSSAFDERAQDVLAHHPLGARGPSPQEAPNHSPFCFALLQGLRGDADIFPREAPGQPAGDGVITATELYLYLRQALEWDGTGSQHRPSQTPGLWQLPRHHSGEYLFLVPGPRRPLPAAPEVSRENNPYRGLEPFEPKHQDVFFGRKRIILDLVQAVEDRPLTIVLAPSGAGKTSLIQAGLLPLLTQRHPDWRLLPPVRPGRQPLAALASALEPILGPATGSEPLAASLLRRLQAGAPPPETSAPRVLLVVDQLEELVTLHPGPAEKEGFLSVLAAAAGSGRFKVLCALRSDYESSFVRGALTRWDLARFPVPAMTEEELWQAIEGPAEAHALIFEPPTLPLRIAREVASMPGALPLLSFTLRQLYLKYLERGATDRLLRQSDYEELEGVHSALWKRARAVFDAFDPARQETMRHMMLRMVSLEGDRARRPVARSELEFEDPKENERVTSVIEVLSSWEARLVVPSEDVDGAPYIEPAHDTLVRDWDYIDIWLEEEKETLPLQRQLTEAATTWVARGRDEGTWHDDPRLDRVLDLEPWVNVTEREFVRASERRKANLSSVRRLSLLAVAVAILTALGITAAKNAELAQRLASNLSSSAAEAEARGDYLTGALLAEEALERAPADDPMRPSYEAKLFQLALQGPLRVSNLNFPTAEAIFSPELRYMLVTSEGDRSLSVWDVTTGERLTAPVNELGAMLTAPPVFSQDGRWIAAIAATASPRENEAATFTVHLWETASGKEKLAQAVTIGPSVDLPGAYADMTRPRLAFSVDGSVLLLRSDAQVMRWDVEQGTALGEVAPSKLSLGHLIPEGIEEGPDVMPRLFAPLPGRSIVGLELLDMKTGAPLSTLPDLAVERVSQIRFLHRQDRLALVTERRLRPWTRPCRYEQDAHFAFVPASDCAGLSRVTKPEMYGVSPGGETVSTLELWTGPPWRLDPGFHPMESSIPFRIVDVSADGRWVLTIALNAKNHSEYGARIWRLEDGVYYVVPLPPEEYGAELRLSRDGQWLYAVSDRRKVHVYDVKNGVTLARALSLPPNTRGLATSRDAHRLISVDARGQVFEWALPHSSSWLEECSELVFENSPVWSRLSPSATHLLTAHAQQEEGHYVFQYRELETGKRLWSQERSGLLAGDSEVAFSPDGTSVAVAHSVEPPPFAPLKDDLTLVELWSTQDGHPLTPARQLPQNVSALRFLSSGSALAARVLASDEVLRWDTTSGTLEPRCNAGITGADTRDHTGRFSLEVNTSASGMPSYQVWDTETCVPISSPFKLLGVQMYQEELLTLAIADATKVLRDGPTKLRLYFARGGSWLVDLESEDLVSDAATGRPFVMPAEPVAPGMDRRLLGLGPAGQTVLTSTMAFIQARNVPNTMRYGERLQLWDAWTGRPVAPEIWLPSAYTRLRLQDETGVLSLLVQDESVQRWFLGTPLRGAPWLRGLARAITGMELDPGFTPCPLSRAKHQAELAALRSRLKTAAEQGDRNAQALLRMGTVTECRPPAGTSRASPEPESLSGAVRSPEVAQDPPGR